MEDLTVTNVVLQLFCVLMLGIILTSQAFSADRKKPLNRIFMIVTAMILILLLADAFAWGFDQRPGFFFRTVTIISNIIVYSIGTVSTALMILYISRSVPLTKKIEQKAMGMAWFIVAAFHILLIINQFNGWIYYIDYNNYYHWGPFYWTGHLAIFLIYSIIAIVVLWNRKKLGIKNAVSFMAYVALPIIAAMINVYYVNLMLLHAAGALAIVVIFVNIHIQREKLMAAQALELQNRQIAVMLSQIKPHFLHNAMTSIANLCDKDPAAAKKAMISFSSYMRGNMESLSIGELISFENELAHVRAYLDLEQAVYGKALKVVLNIETTNFNIPSLTVQPIVENAVKHGIGRRVGGGTISITTKETPDAYFITVLDDGMGFMENVHGERQGIGIENVRNRLSSQLSGTLTIHSETDIGTTAVIEIPKR